MAHKYELVATGNGYWIADEFGNNRVQVIDENGIWVGPEVKSTSPSSSPSTSLSTSISSSPSTSVSASPSTSISSSASTSPSAS